jgi:hypothetical protein
LLVSHTQHHRGPNPEDPALFTEQTRHVLLRACEEATYLLDRGYGLDSVLDVVGRRHALRQRQRAALQRSVCSTLQARLRQERLRPLSTLAQADLEIDGFNLIIGTEVALSRGLLLRGRDGAYRDLAGLRGSYRPVEETELALVLLGKVFGELGVQSVRFFLDQPVSNSGRLKQRILDHAASWGIATEVLIVPDPDKELFGRDHVVTSDALVLDHAKSWVNILGYIVSHELDEPWVLDFSSSETSV